MDNETRKISKELFARILSTLRRLAYSRAGTDSAAELLVKDLQALETKIEPLPELSSKGIDLLNNDDLFTLILEQRFKINEIIEWITKQEQN